MEDIDEPSGPLCVPVTLADGAVTYTITEWKKAVVMRAADRARIAAAIQEKQAFAITRSNNWHPADVREMLDDLLRVVEGG